MIGRQGGHVSQCCCVGEEGNAGQSMKCLGIRHWKKGVETDACCVLVVGSSMQGMENDRMEVWSVSWLGGDGMVDVVCTHSGHHACIQ